MSVVLHLSEDLSRQVEEAAAASGMSPERWVIELLDAKLPKLDDGAEHD